jgi:hypothetical protein
MRSALANSAGSSSTSSADRKPANMRRRSGEYTFSAPTASATSCAPLVTASTAPWSAVEPPAQAFSTLMIGTPSIPIGRSATWPRMQSWPPFMPQPLLANQTPSRRRASSAASASAPATASAARLLMPRSGSRPNRSMPTPRMYAPVMVAPRLACARGGRSPRCTRLRAARILAAARRSCASP